MVHLQLQGRKDIAYYMGTMPVTRLELKFGQALPYIIIYFKTVKDMLSNLFSCIVFVSRTLVERQSSRIEVES